MIYVATCFVEAEIGTTPMCQVFYVWINPVEICNFLMRPTDYFLMCVNYLTIKTLGIINEDAAFITSIFYCLDILPYLCHVTSFDCG